MTKFKIFLRGQEIEFTATILTRVDLHQAGFEHLPGLTEAEEEAIVEAAISAYAVNLLKGSPDAIPN